MSAFDYLIQHWFAVLIVAVCCWLFVRLVRIGTAVAAILAAILLLFLLFFVRLGLGSGQGTGSITGGQGGVPGIAQGPMAGGADNRAVLIVKVVRVAGGNYELRLDGVGEVEPIALSGHVSLAGKLEKILEDKKVSPDQMRVQLAVPPGWPSEARRMLEEFFRGHRFDVSVTTYY